MSVELDILPLVSIIVPVYNGERYLRESLDSIVAQSYHNKEILVLDDASTDGTPDIIASYGNQVQHCRQEKNKGQFENVNDGISRAKGEYIAVYHSDDVYCLDIIDKEVLFLTNHPESGAVFSKDIFIDSQGEEVGRLILPLEVSGSGVFEYPVVFNALLTYKNRFLRGPSGLVRSSAYQKVGLYRNHEYQIASDLEMWVRIARQYPVGILDEYLMRYRRGHGNLSQHYYHLRTESERYFQIINECFELGDKVLAKSSSLSAFVAHQAEDRLMRAVNCYILGRTPDVHSLLCKVNVVQILNSKQVQRVRLFIIFMVLHILVRMPRNAFIAKLFYRRWHGPSFKNLDTLKELNIV